MNWFVPFAIIHFPPARFNHSADNAVRGQTVEATSWGNSAKNFVFFPQSFWRRSIPSGVQSDSSAFPIANFPLFAGSGSVIGQRHGDD